MSIIPVLDLMIGQVVLAKGGNRDAYLPVHSRLTTSSRPVEVAQAIFNQTGCDWLYLADIDSFAGAAPNWNVYRELLDRGFGLWLDADWLTNDRYLEIANQLNQERLKIIVSSETISSRDQFSVFQKLIDHGLSPIFSLDRKGDSIVSQSAWRTSSTALSSYELVQLAYQQGVRDLIVLDLAEVGTGNGFQPGGSSVLLVESIKQELQDISVTSGGGVRSLDDVRQWIAAGCDHVLVASAIHAGEFTPDDVTRL